MSQGASIPAASLGAGPLLDAVFENTALGLALWDLDLRFQRINGVLAEINGFAPEDHIGRSIEELLGDLGAEAAERFRSILRTGEAVVDAEVLGETPSAPGVTRHWRASYFPVRSAGGDIVGILGIVEEVSAELRAQAAMRAAMDVGALLDAVFAATPVGLAFIDTDLRYQRINDALARINGVSADEHIGRTIEEMLGELGRPARELIEQVVATREPLVDMEAVIGEGAEARHIEFTYFPVADERGGLLGVGGVVRDITDRHEDDRQRVDLTRNALEMKAQAEASQVRAEDAAAEAAHQREVAEAARRRMELLAVTGARMASSLDLQESFDQMVRAAAPGIADWCLVTLVDKAGNLEVVAVGHEDPERAALVRRLGQTYRPSADAPTGPAKVVRTGEIEVATDVTDDRLEAAARDPAHLEFLRALGIRHSVIAPIETPRGVVGAVSFIYETADRRPTTADAELALALASRTALHVENARLYADSRHIAHTLQRSLLPHQLPEVPGLELAAAYRPAGEQNEVGGDFYDAFPSEPGVLTAVIGDVAGKGAEAAAVTSLVRHTLHAAALRSSDPGDNLALLNEAMRNRMSTPGRFCTAAYLRVCPSDGRAVVTIANGGHYPPSIVRADGTVEDAPAAPGPLIGIFEDARFPTAEVTLEAGDLMLLYTDGVIETGGADPFGGENVLRDTLEATVGRPAQEIVEAVENGAVEMQHGTPRDDIALLAIRVLPRTES